MSILPMLLGELGAGSAVILSMSLPRFQTVHETLKSFGGKTINPDLFGKENNSIVQQVLSLDVVEIFFLFYLVSFLIFLAYGTQTKPLKFVRPFMFFIAYTPFFCFLCSLLILCWVFGVSPSLSLRFAFSSGLLCWVVWVTVVFWNYMNERNWNGFPSLPLIGYLPSYLKSLEEYKKHQFVLEQFEKRDMSIPTRIGDFRENLIIDPKDVEYMLKTNHKNFIKGPFMKEIFSNLLGNGIFNADGHLWFTQRKSASKEFSVGKFRTYMLKVFGDYAEGVLQRLDIAAQKGETLDIQDMFFRYTLDSFGDLAFGTRVGCVAAEGVQPPFAHAFDQANILTMKRFTDALREFKQMLNIGSERELREHVKTIDDFVYAIIEERKKLSPKELEQKEDFLSRFMRMSDTDQKDSDKYLRDLVINFMIAGRDTTASGLSWTVYELCQHPEVVEKCREEIDSILIQREPGEIMKPIYDQLKDMHYIHAVFSETLRLHPPVPVDGKFIVEDDIFPSGLKVYGGDLATFVPYAMGRSSRVWDNPLQFDPNRWIENGKFKRVSAFKFSVFQAGPRQCLGMDFAYLEAKLMIVMLLQKFNLQLAIDPSEVKESIGLTMCAATGIPVTLTVH